MRMCRAFACSRTGVNMASQEDDNKLECISNVNKQQERYFLNVYKKHEYILNSKNESFENKIESLIDVWKSVGELNLSQFDLRHVIQIMDWAKLHALNIVLTAEWNGFKASYQSKLLDEIEKAQNELLKLNSAFATRCKKLADVVKNPWEDPVLMKLMKTKDAEISTEEIEFFCVETAYLVSVRLKKLCESHCEDLALNLVTAFMNCNKLSKTQNFSLNATETQMWFIFDIYIALLYKFQEKQKIVILLKELSFDEGLQLVKRFAKKRVKISKIWKNCHRIAILAGQLYISQAVVKYTEDMKDFLENYIEIYISLCNNEALLQDFSTSIRRISNLADAAGLYIFCAVIQRKAGTPLKPLVIEMYIRALTTDMNELERQKDGNELEKAAATTSRLAEAFCNLADFLDEHVKVARECVLTAFSLEPTKERLECIETLAKRSGFQLLDTGQEWKCKLHPPTSQSDEITWVCPECGDWMSKPEFNVPIKINMALNEALQNSVLGISESLCDDLVVCLSNPRYQILSWFLPWDDLHRLCVMYLQDPQATKNIVTELKFVDIDYSIFKGIKREPLDEMDGIERGYEQYLDQDFVSDEETTSNSEDSMSQDSRPYSLGSDGAGDGPYFSMLPVQAKSDPNTLKSLRMFRHNLKRVRDKDTGEGIPEKLFKPDSNNLNATTGSVEPQNVETKASKTLNQLLNGVNTEISAIQYPNTSSCMNDTGDMDFHSKNVKTATLPLLGGQVARKENTLIQVNRKHLSYSPQEKEIPSLLKIPLHKQVCKKKVKRELRVKMPNKLSLNGVKENNLPNSLVLESRLPTAQLKVYSRKPPETSKLALVVRIPQIDFNQTLPTKKRENSKMDPLQGVQANQLIQVPNLLHQSKNTQVQHTPVINQSSRSLVKTHILNMQASNQMQIQKELCSQQMPCCKLEQPEKLPASQIHHQAQQTSTPLLDMQSKIVEKYLRVNLYQHSSILHRQGQSPQKMENNPVRDMPSLIPISESTKTSSSSQLHVQLTKVDMLQANLVTTRDHKQSQLAKPQQAQVRCSINLHQLPLQVNNQEKLLNFSFQCPNLHSKQLQPEQKLPNKVQDIFQNRVLQIPIKRMNIKSEPLVKKQLENCSSQSLKKESLLDERLVQLKQVNQEQHRPIPLVTCLKSTNQSYQATNTQAHSLKQEASRPICLLQITTSQNQKQIKQEVQQPICSPTSNQNPEQTKLEPLINCSNQLVSNQNQEQIKQETFQPICSTLLTCKENQEQIKQKTFQPICSTLLTYKQNQEQIKQEPFQPICSTLLTCKQNQEQIKQETFQPICSTLLTCKQNQEQIKQEAFQPICSKLLTCKQNQEPIKELPHLQLNLVQSSNLDHQHNHLASTEKQLLQCNNISSLLFQEHTLPPYTQHQEKVSISKERYLPIKHNQCSPSKHQNNQTSQSLQIQPQSKVMEVNQLKVSISRSSLHNSFCNLPKAPNRCPNLDRLLTSQPNQINLQTSKHKPDDRTELVDLKQKIPPHSPRAPQNPTLQTSLVTEIQTPTKLDKPLRESVLVSLDNPQVKLEPSLLPHQQLQQIDNTRISQTLIKLETKEDYQMQRNSCNFSNTTNKSDSVEVTVKSDSNEADLMCNNKSNCKTNGDVTVNIKSNDGNNNENVENLNSMESAQVRPVSIYSDFELFSDLFETYPEDLFYHSGDNLISVENENECRENNDPEEVLPKNINLTENIRTYTKKSKKKLEEYKDCVKTLTGVNVLDVCKNVNIINSTEKLHSNVQNSPTKTKELKVILCRLPSNKKIDGKCTSNKEENPSIKQKCDRGKTPPKYSRRRKSLDKSENKVGKAPNLVQSHNFSPLQDVNLRVNSQLNAKVCCDLNKPDVVDENKTDCLCSVKVSDNRKSPDNTTPVIKKAYFKSVLSNIPGLNDFQMIRPMSVPQVVNVVQVSGGRGAQTVSIQNSQTSTQVTPHIQRIGQPRVVEQKPEHSNSITSTTQTSSTTSATSRTTTTQPSTLINILSQQIIRPVGNAANAVRRQGPLINILSQQIIRPSVTAKAVVHSTANNTPTTIEANQVKVAVSTEQTILNSTLKTTNAVVKNTNTVAPGQGGTILQFICKSSLPKFQQAFGKTVYQSTTESADSPTTTVEVANSAVTEVKKTVNTKTVPVNLQPIPGSVIYSRQLPAGQAISLLPPGTATTRQVFRIATSNAEQLGLVKDSVIHSKMSALLAAALQGRPKNADGEIILNSDDIKGTVVRPTLVQGARLVKPVQLQMATNVVRANPQQPNLSSTTLEQLREFDMVYKQIKERSTTSISETCTNAEGQEGVPQRISVTYVNQLQKYTQLSPVVVVTSYSSLQPAASPALSVTSQGSSSPCVTPASTPTSTPTLPKLATKNSKGKTIKTTPTNNSQTKSSPIPKPQQKPQEDEHTTQRIFDILAEYAEQLRNSPDLNNKPAPRRRSNPPTNPSQNSKRKKSSSGVKKSGQSSSTLDVDTDDMTIGSEDSSGGGVVQLSVTDDEQSQASTSVNTTESSNENPSPPNTRPVILAEGGPCTNQSRNLIIADSSVGEALKIPNTAVIVPGSYIMPVSMVKGGQQIAVMSGGSKILATVPARSGQNMLLFQSFTNQNRKAISAVKYSTIQPITGITQTLTGVGQQQVLLPSTMALGQPLTLKRIGDDRENSELLLTITQPKEEPKDTNDKPQPDSSTNLPSEIKIENIKIEHQSNNSDGKIFQTYQKTVINSVETSVIATATPSSKVQSGVPNQTIVTTATVAAKAEAKSERIQSVLVTAGSSNGPMLSHTNPRCRKVSDKTHTTEPASKDFLHNGEKPNNEQKTFRGNATYYVNKTKKVVAESQKMDSEMQKQAAIERELRLQKSLSEECEDLGVDEPSTSDLFPEADLLFDSNHSPSFDQTSQDIKRVSQIVEIKEEVKEAMNLFSDDENSGSLRADLFEYVEYQPVDTLNYQGRQMNGNIEACSSGCDDNTLLPKCAAMSEVTLNSPISPEMYQEAAMHKYKFKYSNRKKGDRIKQDYGGEVVSSSEHTIVCTEIAKVNCEDIYKVVHIAKSEIVKEGKCELHCEEDVDSPSSGRGARRSVRKLCSCCNGAQDGNLAKKRPHTPAAPHKKAFLSKKR